MKYRFGDILIKDLVQLIDQNKIELKPFYQRNDIWSVKDQNELIDSLIKGYPIPNFFFYEKQDGKFEMVDGQQRARTIYRFMKGQISSSKETGKRYVDAGLSSIIENYLLSITYIHEIKENRVLQDFYVLVNKKGKHLNVAELNKADYANTNFLNLVESIIENQLFINLDLFTESSKKRMADRSYIEELISYLKLGITDKKIAIQRIYESDLREEEAISLKDTFYSIVKIITDLNNIYPLKKTRFKQRNDFYTLFSFIHQNLNEDINVFRFQYNILLIFDTNNLIRPSIDECEPFKRYALNCVSQSNSKTARLERLQFFNDVLKNPNGEVNDNLKSILIYLDERFGADKVELSTVGMYSLLDYSKLS